MPPIPNGVLGIFQSGATCVIHTASPVPGSKNTALFWKVNVDGTKAVIKASQELGVRKLVYTSSAGVAFNGVGQKKKNVSLGEREFRGNKGNTLLP